MDVPEERFSVLLDGRPERTEIILQANVKPISYNTHILLVSRLFCLYILTIRALQLGMHCVCIPRSTVHLEKHVLRFDLSLEIISDGVFTFNS